MAAKLKSFSYRQQQRIEQKNGRKHCLNKFIQEQLVDLSLLSKMMIWKALARNVWDDNKAKPLSEYTKQVTPLDVEEFFVMIYEYWKIT